MKISRRSSDNEGFCSQANSNAAVPLPDITKSHISFNLSIGTFLGQKKIFFWIFLK